MMHPSCLQACLSWWDVVSPLGGTGATMALVFVLGVSGVKAIAEDVKRHSEDRKINTSITHVLNPDGEPPFPLVSFNARQRT
jgi:hypothetical protein